MDREAIDKICALQAEIDGYRRFILDFLVSIIKREHRVFVVHDETSEATAIGAIWDEYDKLLDENEELKEKLAQKLEEKM